MFVDDAISRRVKAVRACRSASIGRVLAGLLCSILLSPVSARAETIHVTCNRENITAPGWTGPLTATFDGDPNGMLVIRADHTRLDLHGSMATAQDNSKQVWASEDTKAIMPDLADLDACSASKVPKDVVADADFFNIMSMSCLQTVKLSAEPVPIKASVRIFVFSAQDVTVEIKRTYQDPSKGPGGVMYIESYPDGCKVGAAQQ